MDSIQDNIYFMDRAGRIIMINQAGAKWLGFSSPGEVIGKTDLDLFTEEHGRAAFEDGQRIMETGTPLLGLEEKETWENGHETWVSTTKMPLRDRDGRIIGIFGMSRDITEHKLEEMELHRLARRLGAVNRQMEEDLQMAANLQQAFLPQSYPLFMRPSGGQLIEFSHRYLASTQVSGDLCSIHRRGDREAGMLICDVMGHGVRSALITAIVHTMVGDLTRRNLPPGMFFSELNRQLRTVLKSQDEFIFVTASYLVLNAETGILKGASAGHPIPFIVRRDSPQEAVPLHAVEHVHGPALAVIENTEYKTCELQLAPGDAIVMYTDGILEETDTSGEEFGEKRALQVLSSQQDNIPDLSCDSLVDAVKTFHGGTRLNDDICLLSFRWNAPA